MAARPRIFEFAVELTEPGDVTGDRGGTPLPAAERDEWTPEHLVLAGLARCSLKSLDYHAGRAGIVATSSASVSGTVTRRETDGRFAFVEIRVAATVTLDPEPDDAGVEALLAKGERDCFVGASLSLEPVYTWTVNGRQR